MKIKKQRLALLMMLSWTVCLSTADMTVYGSSNLLDQEAAAQEGSNVPLTPDIEPGGSIHGRTLYLVYTAEGLRKIGTGEYGMDKAYMLASDSIDLSGKEWVPIGTADQPFTGYFDGNGCVINGLTMTAPKDGAAGLFGYAEHAVIHNVTLRDYDISGAVSDPAVKSVSPVCASADHCDITDSSIVPGENTNGSDRVAAPEENQSSNPVQDVQMKTIVRGGVTWYTVENESQLRSIGTGSYGLDQCYLQTADIQLSPTEWVPIGTQDAPFTGTYDGNGFAITGLTMRDPNARIIGMFGYADSARICNVTLKDYDILTAGKDQMGVTRGSVLAWGRGMTNSYNNKAEPEAQ